MTNVQDIPTNLHDYVVVVDCAFGGIRWSNSLKRPNVRTTLINQRSHP